MQCPKCKQNIEKNTLKCPNCNAKIGTFCPDCGTYNYIQAKTCSNCGRTLIKICEHCGAANLPHALICRKCGNKFVTANKENKPTPEEPATNIPQYSATMNSQQYVKNKFIEGLKDFNIKIITLAGESGCGKNLVIKSAINEINDDHVLWLLGNCTSISQLSPFGYFQDLFLSFFNINNFCPDTLQLKKNSIRFFKQDFPTLSSDEILDLLNFLYPEELDKYENIYFNKAKMFSIMKKIILTIVVKMKTIFIIDNIEFIDGMSYDFINEIIKDKEIFSRCKIVITSNDSKPGMGIFALKDGGSDKYLDLTIAPFSELQATAFIKQRCDYTVEKDFIDTAVKIANGNPAILEQIILLQEDLKKYKHKDIPFNSAETLINARLGLLKKYNFTAYKILLAMSVAGYKVYPATFDNFDNISSKDTKTAVNELINLGFIEPVNNLACEFKSLYIWKMIISYVKNDNIFEETVNSLYETLNIYKLSSIAILGYILQKLQNNDKAFEVWTLLMKQASYVGDIGLYIIVQKQALKLIENKNNDFYTNVKKNIYTRVGKLLESFEPAEAFQFIQKAILMLNDNDDAEHIELLGYIASCVMQMGNYCGALECVDSVLNKLPSGMSFEKTLIQSRATLPQLKLGNYGIIINSVENELLPEIENKLGRGKNLSVITIPELFNVWINTYLNYAEAQIFQGNNQCFDTIQIIYDIFEKNNITDSCLINRVNLLLALANTMKGDIVTSDKILNDMLKEEHFEELEPFIISRWNFTDILNKFFVKDYDILNNELFNVVAYANNINDNFTKNILKTLLAKVLKDTGHTKKALEILEEQVSYFAKEKISTGVLLSWYLIAEIKMITNGTQFALDIASKALDIAQSPNINNYYFIALFNKLIGEIYLTKQDFESANVYIEKALFIAKQFDMQYLLVNIYLLSAKLYQELALPKTAKRNDYIKQALKIFQLAKNIQIVNDNQALLKLIRDDLNVLTSFCKLNGIILKKDISKN